MAKVIEPLHEDKKLNVYLDEVKPKKVLIVFWHGLGDLIMFLNPFARLQEYYPDIEFTLGVQEGLSFEDVVPKAIFINGDYLYKLEEKPFDLIAKIHFPMSEGQIIHTKGEYCCIHELGIPPACGHRNIGIGINRLVGVHYNITCLPDSCNPSDETAKRIWDDILEAGFIPIETHFEHIFHNPVNEKFSFIDCSVRRVQPRISTLIGLLTNLTAFVGVVSGNLHTALATLPSSRIFFLEKHFKLECFTRLPVARASIQDGEYKGEVKRWWEKLSL